MHTPLFFHEPYIVLSAYLKINICVSRKFKLLHESVSKKGDCCILKLGSLISSCCFRQRRACRRALLPAYRCTMHGSYREYNDYLIRLKNQCIIWCTIAIIPLTLILDALSVSCHPLTLILDALLETHHTTNSHTVCLISESPNH